MPHHAFPWHDAFLAALRINPVLTYAADCVGINRVTAWRAMEADKDFKLDVQDAMAEGRDRMQLEAHRRAFTGVLEPVITQGRHATQIQLDADGQPVIIEATGKPKLELMYQRKFSDALAIAMMKAHIQEFRTERTEITGADGAALQIDETTRQARLQAILQQARERRAAEDFS